MSLPYKEWEELSKLTGNILRPGGLDITNYALDKCNFGQGQYLLDLGCGLGGTIRHLSSLDYTALGIDLSGELLQKAKNDKSECADTREVGTLNTIKSPAYIQAKIQNIPLKDACIHGIFCECVLSLLENKDDILRELHRILHKGGKIIISDIVRKNSDADAGNDSGADADLITANNDLACAPNYTCNNSNLDCDTNENVANMPCMNAMAINELKISCNDTAINTHELKISCIDAAMPLNQLKNILCKIGFKITLEKDYSRALAELAAMLVLHDLQIKDYFLRGNKSCACKQNNDLGYVLLIAEKI